jgi:hypothetical protein
MFGRVLKRELLTCRSHTTAYQASSADLPGQPTKERPTPVDAINAHSYTDRHGSPFHSRAGSAAIPNCQSTVHIGDFAESSRKVCVVVMSA